MQNRSLLFIIMLLLFVGVIPAQTVPDLGEYKTLKCDFHMHTIYSDGLVWPTVRVDEAVREGLDAIAITDHLEYLPHKKYLPDGHNISYEIANKYAKKKNIICIRGAEITRWMPPGHFNALFIQDANKLIIKEFLPVVEEAINQGAFILWNHPGWWVHQPDKVVRWYDIHTTLVERNWLHGIEFANWHEYYPGVLEFTDKYNLAVIGNSDVHGVSSEVFLSQSDHRPFTLVFATERSEAAIKEALFAGRCIAVAEKDILAGPKDLTNRFVKACLEVQVSNNGDIFLTNRSDLPFIFMSSNQKEYLLPKSGTVNLPKQNENVWTIKNVLVDNNNYLTLTLEK